MIDQLTPSDWINIFSIIVMLIFLTILLIGIWSFSTGRILSKEVVDRILQNMHEVSATSARVAGQMAGVEVTVGLLEKVEGILMNQGQIIEQHRKLFDDIGHTSFSLSNMKDDVRDIKRIIGASKRSEDKG